MPGERTDDRMVLRIGGTDREGFPARPRDTGYRRAGGGAGLFRAADAAGEIPVRISFLLNRGEDILLDVKADVGAEAGAAVDDVQAARRRG